MVRGPLRVFCGSDTREEADGSMLASFSRPSIPITVEELVSVLSDAANARRAWLDDFREDEILVSPDLFEVIAAYQHYCRPSA
jgi:hypothetical protein